MLQVARNEYIIQDLLAACLEAIKDGHVSTTVTFLWSNEVKVIYFFLSVEQHDEDTAHCLCSLFSPVAVFPALPPLEWISGKHPHISYVGCLYQLVQWVGMVQVASCSLEIKCMVGRLFSRPASCSLSWWIGKLVLLWNPRQSREKKTEKF